MFDTIQKLRYGWNYLNIMNSKTMEHVSNEEKAYEIAIFNREFYGEGGASHKYSEEECYNSAMDMAKWKDKQFVQEKEKLIDNVCEWLKNNIHDYYMTCEFEQWFDDMYEDLKKEMKK